MFNQLDETAVYEIVRRVDISEASVLSSVNKNLKTLLSSPYVSKNIVSEFDFLTCDAQSFVSLIEYALTIGESTNEHINSNKSAHQLSNNAKITDEMKDRVLSAVLEDNTSTWIVKQLIQMIGVECMTELVSHGEFGIVFVDVWYLLSIETLELLLPIVLDFIGSTHLFEIINEMTLHNRNELIEVVSKHS